MIYRLIAQNNNTFYSAIWDNSILTHFISPFGVYSIKDVFDDKRYTERNDHQVETITQLLKNTEATNHILIPIDLTYSQFLDQYPEWSI